MPSPNVLDLSPTPNKGWRDFGNSFMESLNTKNSRDRDENILEGIYKNIQNPIERLEAIHTSRDLSPERKKEELNFNLNREKNDREINKENTEIFNKQQELSNEQEKFRHKVKNEDRDYALKKAEETRLADATRRVIEKTSKEEKLNAIHATLGAKHKNNIDIYNKFVKEPVNAATPRAKELYQEVMKSGEALDEALRFHAPEGTFPNKQENPIPPPPVNTPVNTAKAKPGNDKATKDNLDAYVKEIKEELKDQPERIPGAIKEAVEDAYADEVPAKKKRIYQEKLKEKIIPPSREEIKQNKEKDEEFRRKEAKAKEAKEKKKPGLNKHIENFSDPKRMRSSLRGGADQAIDEIMNIYDLSEDEAMMQLIDAVDFEYVPREEQQAIIEYWEAYSDTTRQALATSIDELMELNHKRWVAKNDTKPTREELGFK